DRELLAQTHIVDLTAHLTDFVETAALVSCLDLVITVDTSIAHLAGALACPTWILLHYTPDWRWLLGRDDSPWYPTARLFRQDQSRTGSGGIARVRQALLAPSGSDCISPQIASSGETNRPIHDTDIGAAKDPTCTGQPLTNLARCTDATIAKIS